MEVLMVLMIVMINLLSIWWRLRHAVYINRYPDNYLDLIASKLKDNASRWGEERYARFAKLLQFCLSRYFKGGLNMCRQVVAGLTKVLYKVSL